MKKILFAIIAVLTMAATIVPAESVKAQATTTVTRTITAVDTVSWASIASNLKGVQYTFTKSSGTAAGKVILEGTINGTWVPIDSITLANNTTEQTLYKAFTNTTYKGLRFRNTNTSSATGGVVATYLRRPDEYRQ